MTFTKSTPMVSKPGDHCAFSDRTSLPYAITRQQAATGLLCVRDLVRNGKAKLIRNGLGNYTLVTFDTLILNTRSKRGEHASQ